MHLDHAAGPRVAQRLPRTVLVALRPRQWLKNLLLFAGLVFAAKIGDRTRDLEALLAFGVYCSASSAAYLVNDLFDEEADRQHPVKRDRPIASGALPRSTAASVAGALAAAALVGAIGLGAGSVVLLAAFLALQLAYSALFKYVVLLDVATISALFVIRAAAGAEAIDVSISGWLLACTALLSLFIAVNKRRGELASVARGNTSGRRVLENYDLDLLDRLSLALGAVTVGTYAAYSVTGGRPALMPLTIVFVVIGIGRYLYLVRNESAGEEPDRLLVTDPLLLATTFLWTLAAILLFTLQ